MEFEPAKSYEINGIVYYDPKLAEINNEEWQDTLIDIDISKFIGKDEKKSSDD